MGIEIISYTAQINNNDDVFESQPKKVSIPCQNHAEIELQRIKLREELLEKHPKSKIQISFTYKEISKCVGDIVVNR